MKEILYFDCQSGVSGDMVIGALLDLGIDENTFLQQLEKLNFPGYRIEIKRKKVSGIPAHRINLFE